MPDLLWGYAIGTTQIVFLEWLRNRAAHRRALRLLRAELLRLQTFSTKYAWTVGGVPGSDVLPRPPSASATFQPLLAALDWRLTDSIEDDQSALAMITIGDLCELLQQYHADIAINLEKARTGTLPESRVHLDRAVETSQVYDRTGDDFQFVIAEAIREVEERLDRARTLPQLLRLVRRLPAGENPPPVVANDPRVLEFIQRREREAASKAAGGANAVAPPVPGDVTVRTSAWRIYSIATGAAILILADWAIFGAASNPEAVGRLAGVLVAGWIGVALWRKIFSGKNPWHR